MFNIALRYCHVGQAIKKRLVELSMNKADFAKELGIQQQHVNRILERETMETKKLYKICEILDFNFFALFCDGMTPVNAYLAAVALGDGDALNNIGDAALAAQMDKLETKLAGKEELLNARNETIDTLRDQIATLKDQVASLKEQVSILKNK